MNVLLALNHLLFDLILTELIPVRILKRNGMHILNLNLMNHYMLNKKDQEYSLIKKVTLDPTCIFIPYISIQLLIQSFIDYSSIK